MGSPARQASSDARPQQRTAAGTWRTFIPVSDSRRGTTRFGCCPHNCPLLFLDERSAAVLPVQLPKRARQRPGATPLLWLCFLQFQEPVRQSRFSTSEGVGAASAQVVAMAEHLVDNRAPSATARSVDGRRGSRTGALRSGRELAARSCRQDPLPEHRACGVAWNLYRGVRTERTAGEGAPGGARR